MYCLSSVNYLIMFSRKWRKKPDDMESASTEKDTLFNGLSDEPEIPKVGTIDNHNFQGKDVRLLDISSNKEWMAYLSYNRDEMYERTLGPEKVYTTFLTRRRFTAFDVDSNKKVTLKGGSQKLSTEDEHFSVDITAHVKNAGSKHCKFLSISHDGLYIALSFYERNVIHNKISQENVNCLIFQVRNNSIELNSSPKCIGRAVFLSEKNTSLAFIDVATFRYANFSSGASDKTTLDLNIFESGTTVESSLIHNSYIRNSPWLDMKGENDEIKKLITITRHIKHNLITTPFSGGIVRTWSIKENGVRLTSFEAKGQHIMAFSKDYKFTAAYVESNGSINVYNVKSGLLMYRLKSQKDDSATNFEVSHIRFCYGGRYVAMSGWEDDKVVFEIWYLEAERSIYRKSEEVGKRSYDSKQIKVFEPFVKRVYNTGEEKCLVGFYMSNEGGYLKTKCMELHIDKEKDPANIEWLQKCEPSCKEEYEISNNLLDYKHLKCGYINVEGMKYLIRFGRHTVQLWSVKGSITEEDPISEEDQLLYIRAYKAPDYGRAYSFRDSWKIYNFDSIKFVGNNPLGRLIVNIRDTSDDNSSDKNSSKVYHTEEIFLPLDEVNNGRKFDYHQLESACQALHFLFRNRDSEPEVQVRSFTDTFIKLITFHL
ncbi:hypothetical protein HPULCUR_009397 [Helicostylum pulchrum]|uniref:Uncharacterized protein n=1 Tax=Helicostylum pulchrum TaxID=562976 RepID=A0ABP9YAC5_9FUNG